MEMETEVTYKRFTNVEKVKVMQVVEVKSLAGNGTSENPYHQITEYFDLEGNRLARVEDTQKKDLKTLGEWKGAE